jgi:hypothetical protein
MIKKVPSVQDVLEWVGQASVEDLRQVNNSVVSRIRGFSQEAKAEFSVGDRVEFEAVRRGHSFRVTGKVVRVGRTRVRVVSDAGQRWTVGPLQLKKGPPAEKGTVGQVPVQRRVSSARKAMLERLGLI